MKYDAYGIPYVNQPGEFLVTRKPGGRNLVVNPVSLYTVR